MSIVLFEVWGFPVYAYGFALALSVGLSAVLAEARCKKQGLPKDSGINYVLIALPLAFVLGRLLYSLINLESILTDFPLSFVLEPWKGGFALMGVLLGASLALPLSAKWSQIKPATLADALAPAGALLLALSRFCEILSGEGIGRYVDNPSICFFPIAVAPRPDEWYYAVFFWEGLWALALAIYLSKRRSKAPGDKGIQFFLLFAASQIVFESLRGDNYLQWGFVRVSQLGSLLICVGIALFFTFKASRQAVKAPAFILPWLGIFLSAGIVILMEFAREKAPELPNLLVYAFMVFAMYALVVLVRHLQTLAGTKR